ncbi:flagellar basal-body MS-ring/collar protein FliF [Buchnera aphidicola (Formosaphis micheliae)]|uniref:flagellar basal-body MS-ring/collar protein FliF n=1 Tax=Buchnera aphidicola TaxID=9 RepID=UPI0031CC9E17
MNFKVKNKIDSHLNNQKTFFNFFNRFNFSLKSILILLVLIFFIISLFLSCSKTQKYSVLYDNLSIQDKNTIVSHLSKMKIPYQFNDHSGALLVPDNTINDIRFKLTEYGLPRGSSIGFELLDKEKFGTSQFNEQINYQRALEGELARTIEKLNSIRTATVHLALPKSSVFIRDKKVPTASLVLELQTGKYLDKNQVNSILQFVSNSVSGLMLENITIIDQFGTLLNPKHFFDGEFNEMRFKYSEELENRYKKRIEDILTPVVGKGNVHAQVTAQINFNHQDKMEEHYQPNYMHFQQSIRSRQSTHNSDIGDQHFNVSIPHNLSHSFSHDLNKIDKDVPYVNRPLDRDVYFPNDTKIHSDDTVNYELDRIVTRTQCQVGEIQRLSVAVVVNYMKDKLGNFVPLSENQIKGIENLTRQSIGYSEHREDSVNVVNALFVNNSDVLDSKNINVSGKNVLNLSPKIKKIQINDITLNSNTNEWTLVKDYLIHKFNNLFKYFSYYLLILFMIILIQYIVFKMYIKKKRFSCLNNQQEDNKIEQKKENNKYIVDKNINFNSDSGKNTVNINSKTDMNKIEMIIKKWMSDRT